MRSKGFIIFLLAFFGLVAVPSVVLSQEEQKPQIVSVEVISGEVASVDLAKSALVIKQLKDQVNKVYEEVALSVDSSTSIQKGPNTINLSEIKIGDMADVEYAVKEGRNIAAYIWVAEQPGTKTSTEPVKEQAQ